MNRIRYLAAGLLCLTGIIHVARLGMAQLDAAFVTTAVIFGVVYLIIGIFLFRNNKTAYYFGAIVPLIGLCGGPLILTNPPIPLVAFLGAIEVVVVLSCFYLIKGKRSASKAPRSN
jgi:FtsH-binding integral membrane protein